MAEAAVSVDFPVMRPFAAMTDPRKARGKRHDLTAVLIITLCAVICGADNFSQVADYATASRDRLREFLHLPHGTPSADTFERIFSRMDPDALEKCFQEVMRGLVEGGGGSVIAVDGKTLRHSFDAAGNKAAIHMVSAFVQKNRMVLGQMATEEKSNEITAIPKLLEMLNLRDATVTIDAMGCQRAICQQIIDQGGQYVVAVKENQPMLHAKVTTLLDEGVALKGKGMQWSRDQQVEKSHGRITTRTVYSTPEVGCFRDMEPWPSIASAMLVESKRQVIGKKETVERRYYISSLDGQDAKQLGSIVRGHWSIENQLHWVLDMTFNEDANRTRKGVAAENLSRIRRLALNMIRRAPEPVFEKKRSDKTSVPRRRFLASLLPEYLMTILQS